MDFNKVEKDYPIKGLIKDWFFRIEKNGGALYLIKGIRKSGETLVEKGNNKIALIEKISTEAFRLDLKYYNPSKEIGIIYYFDTDIPKIFPKDLKIIILEEIIMGNWILDYWKNYGFGVLFAKSFQIRRENLVASLQYIEVNDPHYWKDEIRYIGTDFFVAATSKK